jgi:hypothetical protein
VVESTRRDGRRNLGGGEHGEVGERFGWGKSTQHEKMGGVTKEVENMRRESTGSGGREYKERWKEVQVEEYKRRWRTGNVGDSTRKEGGEVQGEGRGDKRSRGRGR